MVLHNPNNWHWVNKDVGPWAKDYLDSKVKEVSAEEDGVSAKVTKLTSMDGDVDVSQRKGKVITIFDVSLRLDYEGRGCRVNQFRTYMLTAYREEPRGCRCRRKHQSARMRLRHRARRVRRTFLSSTIWFHP